MHKLANDQLSVSRSPRKVSPGTREILLSGELEQRSENLWTMSHRVLKLGGLGSGVSFRRERREPVSTPSLLLTYAWMDPT